MKWTVPDWMEFAACAEVDPTLWFPESGGEHVSKKAKAICATCPVKAECLELAESIDPYPDGIWAGMSHRERQDMRMGRRGAA